VGQSLKHSEHPYPVEKRTTSGWHLSVQFDTSGLQFPLNLRLVVSVFCTTVAGHSAGSNLVPPPAVPPHQAPLLPQEASPKSTNSS